MSASPDQLAFTGAGPFTFVLAIVGVVGTAVGWSLKRVARLFN